MSAPVIPAQAGIHKRQTLEIMESRLRGNSVWVWLLSLLLLLVPLTAQAQTFPALTGRVVDVANIIPADQKAALDAKLTAFEASTGRQFVVATIPSLEGYPIEDYGYRLGRAWAIGDKQKDDGVILLVAPDDRKVRIEVGYGANVYMTDALSSVIINSQIVPQFKAGNYPAGIMAGADAIIEQMQLSPEEAAKRAQQAAKAKANPRSNVSMGDIIFWLVIFFFFILPMLRSMFGGKRGRRHGSGSGPVIIWGGGSDWGGGSGGGWGGGGFGGGGGSFGGGGASGGW